MTLRNRVMPDGRIVADPARGAMMGNRGILHDEDRNLGRARWRHRNWVACRLEFRGRRRPVMAPWHYTELFFLDEAVAFAAGHRPCGECRRGDYLRFKALWETAHGGEALAAKDLDAALHLERAVPRTFQQRRHEADLADLPDGAFVLIEGVALLVWGDELLPYAPAGYGAAIARPKSGRAVVLTPPGVLDVFRAGYRPGVSVPC
jgi:hypothetical protein